MFKVSKLGFSGLLIFISLHSLGINRYFTWVNPKTKLRERINLDSYELLTEKESGDWLNEGKVKLDPAIFSHLPADIDNHFFIYENGKKILISISGTGQVFEYYPLTKDLVRLDRTFHSGFNFSSNLFIRNKTLYSIGGEGFWNYSPSIIYFDEKVKEWEILRPKNKGPLAIIKGYQGYDSKLDVYYSGGSSYSTYLEKEDIKYIDELYRFDFQQNKWDNLGKLNPDLPFKKSHEVIWTGKAFLHFADGNIYIIYPDKNEAYLYKDNKKSFRWGYSYLVDQDTIVSFWGINHGPIIKISLSEIQHKATYFGRVYTNRIELWCYLGISGLILFIAVFYYRKKRNESTIDPTVFSELEKKLLLRLLELRPEEYLTTHDINDILGTADKSQENQRRIRFNVINQINKKIELRLACKNGIERTSLPEDKRLTVYKLNQKVFADIQKQAN